MIQPLMVSSLLGVFFLMACATPPENLGNATNGGAPENTLATDSESSPISLNRDWQRTTVVENLEHPWGLAWLPDGTMLITERPGRLRIVRDGVLDPTPVAGLPEMFPFRQGGLLDIVVHPRFAENSLIYFTYSHGTQEANGVRVARGELRGNTLENVEVIFQASPLKSGGQHFGSRMLWLPDETLLVSIGDGGNPPLQLDGELIRLQAQNRGSHLGTIVRINDDGSIPSDNPWVEDSDSDPAVWSYGHRNIQGLAIDAQRGQVWSTEHGSRGGDELNPMAEGENYGWPLVTHSREYTGGRISDLQSHPDMVDPEIVWTPAIAPSGLAVHQGDLFAGGLVSEAVHHIQLNDSGEVVDQRAIPIGQRVRDVRESPDGSLYVLTDSPQGQLIRLE
ncbi:PQQ-dependent sugar dehydrogenase [Spirulina subsalsa]|uniref:PQQ-dependent sugar dehydrogenase n=1 Tax=Spirulina subsalsa TaxID=54311 RepID=UPI0002F78462